MKKVKIVVADPSGNITIFVVSPCDRKDYQKIAQVLLAHKELKGEQVGFVKSIGTENIMEMAGLEFCGNAGRAFGLYAAQQQSITENTFITIQETGAAAPLQVEVKPATKYTKIRMPDPVSVKALDIPGLTTDKEPMVVDLGGIVHVVLRDVKASQEIFDTVKKALYAQGNPAAMGTIFFNTKDNTMVPIVYVKSIDSTYWEGSCGSGSQATAVALSTLENSQDGNYSYTIKQPAGTIIASVAKKKGRLAASYIEGPVAITEPQEITIED